MEQTAKRGDLSHAAELAVAYPPVAAARRNPVVRAALEEIIGEYSWIHYRDTYESASYGPLPIERLSDVARPTLVVTGEEDVPIFRDGETLAIAGQIPGAKLRVIEGSGRMVNMERPDEFNAAVMEFLARSRTVDSHSRARNRTGACQ